VQKLYVIKKMWHLSLKRLIEYSFIRVLYAGAWFPFAQPLRTNVIKKQFDERHKNFWWKIEHHTKPRIRENLHSRTTWVKRRKKFFDPSSIGLKNENCWTDWFWTLQQLMQLLTLGFKGWKKRGKFGAFF
jgi:hypothetical protein